MGEVFRQISTMSLVDVVDILTVALLFYFLFSLLRGTRSAVALRGMITLLLASFFIYFLARFAHFAALKMIFENVWIMVVLVFVIVFQNDFKKAITDIGQLRIFRALFTQSGEYVNEIVKAIRVMSARHMGALIVIERRNSLRPYADTGTAIDSNVQADLIQTIFTPYSPLHDGAIILHLDRIVSTSCILPLTDAMDLGTELGTRHRAAIGLSEETDAIILVVSEETGIVSLAINGVLERNLDLDELKRRLDTELDIVEKEEEDSDVSQS